jgi:hypothetical protein
LADESEETDAPAGSPAQDATDSPTAAPTGDLAKKIADMENAAAKKVAEMEGSAAASAAAADEKLGVTTPVLLSLVFGAVVVLPAAAFVLIRNSRRGNSGFTQVCDEENPERETNPILQTAIVLDGSDSLDNTGDWGFDSSPDI